LLCNPEEERLMPIAKITGQGLAAIALSVLLLWSCFVGAHLTVKRAVAQQAQVMRELHQLQRDRQAQPVSAPRPQGTHPVRATVG
jgi:hypothetical protein